MRNVIYVIKNILHGISNRLETTEEWVTDLVERSTELSMWKYLTIEIWVSGCVKQTLSEVKGKIQKFLNIFNHIQRYFYTIFLLGLHRTIQLLQHYWSGHRLGSLWYWMVCLANKQRSLCRFWYCTQVLHFGIFYSKIILWGLLHFY